MKKMKSLGLIVALILTAFCISVIPIYGAAKTQQKIEPVTSVKSYTEFYNVLNNAVKGGKASLAVNISNYNSKTYNLETALNQVLDGLKQANSVLTEFKAVSKLSGKSNRMNITFKYESADGTAYTDDALYNEVIKAARESKQKLRIKTTKQMKSSLDADRLYRKAAIENVEIFYLSDVAYTWSVPALGNYCILTIDLKYAYDSTRLTAVKAELDKKTAEIIGKVIAYEMTENDKELALHDYVVRNTTYDFSGKDETYTPYSVLIKGKGNSYGYAKAMQLLLNKAGIECRTVAGEDGAWNIVKIDGDYYHLDASGNFILDEKGKVIVTHDYFNLSDQEMAKAHKWNRQEHPACISMKANYFIKNNTMANNETEMYAVLKNAIENVRPSTGVKVKNLGDADKISDIVKRIVNDHPDLDYISAWRWQVNEDMSIVNIIFTYDYPVEQLVAMKNETEAKAGEIVKQLIKPEMTDYEKELILHDYIVNNARYDSEKIKTDTVPFEEHDAYGVLIKRLGVCDSYAEAFKMLLNKAGVECIIVEGDEINAPGEDDGIGHAWNIVKIDGEYYHVDPTWDDPVSEDGSQTLLHSYFNLTDEEMAKTHTWERSKYPACTDTKNNFYIKSNRLAGSNSDIIRIVKATLDKREYLVEFKIKNYSESSYNLRSIFQSVLNHKAQSASWSVDKGSGVVELTIGY